MRIYPSRVDFIVPRPFTVRRFILGAFLTAIAFLPRSATAQARPPAEKATSEGARAVHLFLLAIYPDLLARPTFIEILPLGGGYAVRVMDPPAKGSDLATQPSVLSAIVSFDADGQLDSYRATGLLVDDSRNTALQQQLAAHPDWTDGDADLWMQSIGGASVSNRTAPNPGPLAAQPIAKFLGNSVEVRASAFRWRGDRLPPTAVPPRASRPGFEPTPLPKWAPPPPPLAVAPMWVVEVVSAGRGAKALNYRLEYEPFGGRLIGAVRQ
ncbi:MAG: hypothetical protein ABIW19_13420 [Vicinamibacterales bacterium]